MPLQNSNCITNVDRVLLVLITIDGGREVDGPVSVCLSPTGLNDDDAMLIPSPSHFALWFLGMLHEKKIILFRQNLNESTLKRHCACVSFFCLSSHLGGVPSLFLQRMGRRRVALCRHNELGRVA